jgi:hypothetical protein
MKITKTIFQPVISSLGYKVEPEFKFCPTRKFRADWKVSKGGKSVLVEYEGLVNGMVCNPVTRKMTNKSGHTTKKGYTSNCEKYNLAQLEGYIILRYTSLNFDNVINDLDKYFN